MKLYVIGSGRGRSQYSLSVDPGVVTSGYAFLDSEAKTVVSWAEKNEGVRVLELQVPELLQAVKGVVQKNLSGAIARIGREKVPATEVILEYPHVSGEFSMGLAVCLTWMQEFFVREGFLKVTYIPARIPEWFLKVRSVSGRETVDLAKSFFPHIRDKRVAVHECDALLFSLFKHYDFYHRVFGVNARPPQYEIVDVGRI